MKRLVALFAVGAAFAIGAAACGDGDKKPPLTPDSEKPLDGAEAGAPAAPAVPGSATPAK